MHHIVVSAGTKFWLCRSTIASGEFARVAEFTSREMARQCAALLNTQPVDGVAEPEPMATPAKTVKKVFIAEAG